MSLKQLLRTVVPAPLRAVARRARGAARFVVGPAAGDRATAEQELWFVGRYARWADAERAADGYAAPAILERVRAASAKVRDEPGWFERDGVLFAAPQWNFALLALLARIASRHGNALRVVDVGGSLGSTYQHARAFFGDAVALHWSIVEQPHFVACGKREFETRDLRFFASVDDLASEPPHHVVLLSGLLPYVAEPYGVLAQVAKLAVPSLIIDRHPFVEARADRIAVQRVPAYIYGVPVRYPAWLFSHSAFTARVGADWRLALEADGTDGRLRADDTTVRYEILLLER